MLYIGTSGYSYTGWIGCFYPEGMRKWEFLAYYQRHFNAVEINYSYYSMPSRKTMLGLVRQTRTDFKFCVKAHRSITQARSQETQLYTDFLAGIEPLIQHQRLLCVLLQFPPSFNLQREHVNQLAFIRQQWPNLPLAVEFRHRSWTEDERTFSFLREKKIAYCCVDEPPLPKLLPPLAVVTADFAYVRFHGRNAAAWSGQSSGSRYDYQYSRQELEEWAGKIRQMQTEAENICVFFNNTDWGYAVQNARQLAEILGHPICFENET